MKFTLICPDIHGSSGYSNHAKGLLNALGTLADVKLKCGLPMGWERQTNDLELLAITKEDSQDRINIILDLPNNWKLHTDKKKNLGYVIWEGSHMPQAWIEEFKNPDIQLILVPSEHVRTAIKNTTNDPEIIKKIKIVPHGADRSVFYPDSVPQKSVQFRFLMNKGFRNPFDRGGIQHGIIAFIQEFKDENVELSIHFNPAYAMNPDQFNQYLSQIGYTGKPKISASWDNLDQNQLRNLYNSCDVFLNPTEAEAFSIPSLEAMACGKPVIATNFGGQTDFVNNNNGWLINGQLHPVLHEILYEGISWCRPDLTELRKAMREAFENRNSVEAKSTQALKDSKDLTWLNSSAKLIEYAKDL